MDYIEGKHKCGMTFFCFVTVHPKQELIFVSVLFINAWLKFHCIIYDHTNKDTGLLCSKLDLYTYHRVNDTE